MIVTQVCPSASDEDVDGDACVEDEDETGVVDACVEAEADCVEDEAVAVPEKLQFN